MNTTADAGGEQFSQNKWRGPYAGRMNKKPWSIYEVGAVLGSFVIFWPLGLVALFVKMKKGELWNGASEMKAPWASDWASWKKPEGFGDFNRSWKQPASSGNQAFDDYRRTEFGGWPWADNAPVHGPDGQRFAKRVDGSIETPPGQGER